MLSKFRLKEWHGWSFNLGYIHVSYQQYKGKIGINFSISNWE